jgi:hypothetical protein
MTAATTAARLVAAAVPLSLLLALCTPASAEVYRCTNAAGATEFSDAPCPKGSQGGSVEVKPNVLDHSGAREQTLKAENQRLQEQLAAQPAGAAGTKTAADAPRVDSFACKQAQRDLEVAASSIEKVPATLRTRQTAMYAACGLREPDRPTTNIRINNGGDRPRPTVVQRP